MHGNAPGYEGRAIFVSFNVDARLPHSLARNQHPSSGRIVEDAFERARERRRTASARPRSTITGLSRRLQLHRRRSLAGATTRVHFTLPLLIARTGSPDAAPTFSRPDMQPGGIDGEVADNRNARTKEGGTLGFVTTARPSPSIVEEKERAPSSEKFPAIRRRNAS